MLALLLSSNGSLLVVLKISESLFIALSGFVCKLHFISCFFFSWGVFFFLVSTSEIHVCISVCVCVCGCVTSARTQ